MFTRFTTLRTRIPPLPISLERVATFVLGKRYTIILIFVGDTRSRTLNRTYRKKDHPTNVLAFPTRTHAADIFINIPRAHKEAHRFGKKVPEHIARLFIHALLHLKGLHHGGTMDMEEERIYRRFKK